MKIGRFGKSDDDLKFQEVVERNVYQLADKTLEILDRKFFNLPKNLSAQFDYLRDLHSV